MKLSRLLSLTVLSWAAIACSSGIKKAQIPASANPHEEIAKLDQKTQEGYAQHFDVLADSDFSKSRSYLEDAREGLRKGRKQSKILEDIAYSEAYYERAAQRAAHRHDQIPGVIEMRQKALDAGARQFPLTQKLIGRVDSDLRDETESMSRIKAEDIADLQGRYSDIELKAIQSAQLGNASARIQGAKDKRAKKYVPMALKRAELDYATAENLIVANRNNPQSYSDAVAKANRSAELLTDILASTHRGELDENSATQIVLQKNRIKNLEGRLGEANEKTEEVTSALQQQGVKLKEVDAKLTLQQSIESARQEFSKEEADVYQQGDKLLIRLKSMNFPTGSADLPSDSLSVLAKVKNVASELGASEVRVEGHTDSTGPAKLNRKISEERAEAIAKYLETNGIPEDKLTVVGYGYEKPIASNKSKTGRSQNRRVDVVITP